MNDNTNIKPLSEAAETTLIIDAQAGNERAMERLLDQFAPVIEGTAFRYMHDGEYDDALQEARLAFIQIVNEHDFDKSTRLSAYVKARMGHELRDSLSASHGQFSIPTRTVQLFYQVYNAADGDLTLGAQIAPNYEMASSTFMSIADMLHTGSLDAATRETEDGGASLLDTFDGAPLGGDVAQDEYDVLLDRMTALSIMQNAQSPAHLRVIRKAYGFEGDLEIGEDEPSQMLSSRDSVAAHIDMTVAANLTFEDGEKWSRAKVQRLRTGQLNDWKQKYAESEASDGKDN